MTYNRPEVDPADGARQAVEALRIAVASSTDPTLDVSFLQPFEDRLRSIAVTSRFAGGPCSCSAGVPCPSTDVALQQADLEFRQMLAEFLFVAVNVLGQLVERTEQNPEVFLQQVESDLEFTRLTRPEEG